MDYNTSTAVWPGWETVRKIGSGSFGSVYEIQRDVYGDIEKAAVKVISIPHSDTEIQYLRSSGADESGIAQTLRNQLGQIAGEYRLMARMRDNPNIVQCSDFREVAHSDGLGWDLCIKMELLTPLLARPELISTEAQIIRLGKDICNALITCQANNIIHRDIKPQNVFVSGTGQFKLGDFGIARTMERSGQATAGVGTYSYMAPEVVKNAPYGKAADVYSLGLTLYWCLNERRAAFVPLPPAVPSCSDEELAAARRFSGEPIPAPKNGSEALKQIVLKACAYDPAARYQTAQQLYDALQALEAGSRMADDRTVNVFGGSSRHSPITAEKPPQRDYTATVGPAWVQTPAPAPVPPAAKRKQKWPILPLAIAAIVIAIVVVYMTVPLFATDVNIASVPNRTEYGYGDTLDLEGLNVLVVYQNGSVAFTEDYTCDTDVLLVAGPQVVTITHGGHEAKFLVNVAEPGVISLEIASEPLCKEYWIGDTVNTDGLMLTATYEDRSTDTIDTGFDCSHEVLTEQGEYAVEVYYGGKSTSFNVAVKKPELTLSSNKFEEYHHRDHTGKGYVHVTPQTWHTEKERPFWKLPLPEATTAPAGCEVTWKIAGGDDAEIHAETNEVWIYDIGTVIARASFTYNGIEYTADYQIDFNLYKLTAGNNTMRKTPNDVTAESKVCVVPGKDASGNGGTILYITELRVFPEQYYAGVNGRYCMWGKTTYTDENGNAYTGWVPCSKDEIPAYSPNS